MIKHYTVKIPLRILDVGGQDFIDILETKDLVVKAGTNELTPLIKTLTFEGESIVEDSMEQLHCLTVDLFKLVTTVRSSEPILTSM